MASLAARLLLIATLSIVFVATASAQGFDIKGYGMVGTMRFAAEESFDAVLDSSSGLILGGGVEVGLPLGGLYVGVGAWRFEEDGERVFVSGSEAFPLGIPLTVTITPIEITGGWRFPLSPRFIPYAGGGWSSYAYEETSSFAEAGENVDDRFSGFHLLGGVEFKIVPWLGVAGEVNWTSIPDSLGSPGSASDLFDERNLGGTSYRLKITVGR